MYSILQAKWSQSQAFVSALLDADGDILHTLPHGHIDSYLAYPGTNQHCCLLKELHNSMVKQCNMLSNSLCNGVPSVAIRNEILETHAFRKQNPSLTANTKQFGGNSENAQVSQVKPDPMIRYSNTDLIKILQNPDKSKLSYNPPIKLKEGKIFVLDWQNNESQLKDYVADQYLWIEIQQNIKSFKYMSCQKYYNIQDHDLSESHASKLSLGIHNVIPTKQNINLSQLTRNSRTRVDKKSGRK